MRLKRAADTHAYTEPMDLFDHGMKRSTTGRPLADRMRPRRLEEIVGQEQLLASGKLLRLAIENDRIPSMVLWGPPGTGKTTLAQVIASETRAAFVSFSAVLSGVADLRRHVAKASEDRRLYERQTVLFVDEIHRFNKSQQDALLPHVENGTVVLIGATTENPSFAVNAALLSRARVFRLESLEARDLIILFQRALNDRERGLGDIDVEIDPGVLERLAEGARGDARRGLDVLEFAVRFAQQSGGRLDSEAADEALAQRTLLYDKSGEEHYNVVSALIKSLRGSDPDASVYWMMRMVEAGDDPLYVLRRLIIFASEDIGNADPRALNVAVSADQAFQRLGLPEGLFAMAQCCTYLACAPKSNASYRAFVAARDDIRASGPLPVPKKLRNAPTEHMKNDGYGEGYRYPHDEGGYVGGETYLPDALLGRRYYQPTNNGLEARIRERLARLRAKPGDDS